LSLYIDRRALGGSVSRDSHSPSTSKTPQADQKGIQRGWTYGPTLPRSVAPNRKDYKRTRAAFLKTLDELCTYGSRLEELVQERAKSKRDTSAPQALSASQPIRQRLRTMPLGNGRLYQKSDCWRAMGVFSRSISLEPEAMSVLLRCPPRAHGRSLSESRVHAGQSRRLAPSGSTSNAP
jgi:hypothetical protein